MTTSNFTTYDQVGKVEAVSDIITNIAPTQTPFQSMIGTEAVHQPVYQWQEDSLLSAGTNAAVEGATAPTAVMQPTVMRSSVTQILTKTAQATGTADKTKTYGRAEELAYQQALRSKELKRDLEYALVGSGQSAVTGSASVARKMDSYQSMVPNASTYTVNGGAGAMASVVGSPTAGALREDILTTLAQALYTAGADVDTIMVKPSDSVVIASFAANNRTRYVENGDKKLVNSVTVYESPFGPLKVVMNRFQRTQDAFVFESAMWKRTVLRNWFTKNLAITGDSSNVQILGEFGLKHRNFAASGLITNLT
jgi:hypothetical protein